MAKANGERVAIVAGVRTPFAKQGTAFKDLTALDLGKLAVAELLSRTALRASEVDQVVYGQVIPSVAVPNIARELVLGVELPRSVEAYSVSRACTTSYQSTVNVAEAIMAGVIDVGIAGGADSASDIPMVTSKPLAGALLGASRARGVGKKLASFRGLSPQDLLPIPPALKEPSTGLTMGESAEKMAKENGISRQWQDEISLASHKNAARAWKAGYFKEEVMNVPIPPKYKDTATIDNLVREDTSIEALAKLKPAFDRRYGTVTAGNASPLTDGAAALLLMSEEKAKALGYEILGYLKSYAFAATDPGDQLLQGPAYAAPIALDRAGLKLKDIELIDMHEAFAAQVASNIQAFESKAFAEKLGRSEALGEVNREILNVNGGSISLGHPFAATGARIIHQSLRELKRRGKNLSLVTVCAQGGQGAAVVLERE